MTRKFIDDLLISIAVGLNLFTCIKKHVNGIVQFIYEFNLCQYNTVSYSLHFTMQEPVFKILCLAFLSDILVLVYF